MSFMDEIKKVAALKVGKPMIQSAPPGSIQNLMRVTPPVVADVAAVKAPGGCGGCGAHTPPGVQPEAKSTNVSIEPTFLMNLKDLTGSLRDMAAYVVGESTSEEEFAKRKSACETCPAKDSSGRPLYREFRTTWFSCGALRHQDPLRDSSKDGCGCVLNIKWASKPQTCPLKEPRW